MVITSKLSDNKLLEAIHRAAAEYSKLIGNEYLVIGKNKNSNYFWFQCRFEKKNFMHLLGIDSKTLRADEFYDRCDEYNNGIGTGILISDCHPSRNHNRTTINEKSSCCADMLRIKDAKYMKVGLKDKISQFVDFSYAYGSTAILGFQKVGNMSSFPITLIARSIDEFTSKKYKIICLLEKKIEDEKYRNILVEIKQGLLLELYFELPNELKALIINGVGQNHT